MQCLLTANVQWTFATRRLLLAIDCLSKDCQERQDHLNSYWRPEATTGLRDCLNTNISSGKCHASHNAGVTGHGPAAKLRSALTSESLSTGAAGTDPLNVGAHPHPIPPCLPRRAALTSPVLQGNLKTGQQRSYLTAWFQLQSAMHRFSLGQTSDRMFAVS